MAISSRSPNNWIFSLKVVLTSTAIFSVALILKLSIPVMLQFIVSELPLHWSSLLSWLTPPYLYVVINGIIITIAASSRFHHKVDDEHQSEPVVAPLKVPLPVDFSVANAYDSVVLKNPVEIRSDFGGIVDYNADVMKNRNDVRSDYEVPVKEVYGEGESKIEKVKSIVGEDNGFVISKSNWTPNRRDSTEIRKEFSFSPEKPLVSVRFGHRKLVKASPEGGKPLGVAKPKRNDTLESTWKTITDGRPIPLARHLKKSDTWETHGRQHHTAGPQEANSPKMKKCETFKDRTAASSPGSGKLKKEPSLSHDELNRRVEAFINKFNEEMRLQRQESLNQYKEMVNRR